MANPNVGQRVASNWELVVKTKPEDQIHNDYWLFNQMSEGKGFIGKSGGDFISGPIEYALNTTVQSYSDTDEFSTTRVDVFDRYEYQWKEYVGTVLMSELEKDRNSGEGQVFDLLPAKMESLRKSLRRKLNEDAYGDGTGNSGKAITGLAALVSSTPTTGTVGGINRANFSFWRNQQTSGAQSSSAFDNLRATMRSIYNLCSNGVSEDHPSFGVTDRTVFEGYESLLVANERFTDKKDGDGAFKNERLKFKGMMLSYDTSCTASTMYFLNPEFYKWIYKTGAWMKGRPAVNPANQTVDIFAVRSMLNTIATQPRRLGVLTAIT
jgi:hypothetical protein